MAATAANQINQTTKYDLKNGIINRYVNAGKSCYTQQLFYTITTVK